MPASPYQAAQAAKCRPELTILYFLYFGNRQGGMNSGDDALLRLNRCQVKAELLSFVLCLPREQKNDHSAVQEIPTHAGHVKHNQPLICLDGFDLIAT
jgi:hypothetical protein